MLVGPGMAGLGSRAGERTSASAADYLHESILNPNAHVVEGYPAGVMPQNYADSLTEDQINDLVAYMLSL
jgi:mono/diheme cytochrome c family protein